jgi:ACS family pantothenate transporter-like MFS transporter
LFPLHLAYEIKLTEVPTDRKDELAKRASIFGVSGSIAIMFSGYLMSAVINLNGRNGLKGWQWQVCSAGIWLHQRNEILTHDLKLFVIDGTISLPIAVAGFFLFPDFPRNTRAWYINENVRINITHCIFFSDVERS